MIACIYGCTEYAHTYLKKIALLRQNAAPTELVGAAKRLDLWQ